MIRLVCLVTMYTGIYHVDTAEYEWHGDDPKTGTGAFMEMGRI